jgi:hypothetical protein
MDTQQLIVVEDLTDLPVTVHIAVEAASWRLASRVCRVCTSFLTAAAEKAVGFSTSAVAAVAGDVIWKALAD